MHWHVNAGYGQRTLLTALVNTEQDARILDTVWRGAFSTLNVWAWTVGCAKTDCLQ